MINQNHNLKYDYFYLPMDLKVNTLLFIFIFRHNAMLGMHL